MGDEAGAAQSQVLRLSVCSALSVTTMVLTIAVAPVVGADLAPRAFLATLPLSLAVLASTAALPAALLMARIGRRPGFFVGTAIGAAGAALAALAIVRADFVLFCIGTAGLGALNGFQHQYRFAAAELWPGREARGVSWVLAGGVVAGLAGPAIATTTKGALAGADFLASYLVMLGLMGVIGLILLGVRLPPAPSIDLGAGRPLRVIAADPRVPVAVGAAVVAYACMALLMTAAPLSILAAGHPYTVAAIAIQAHVVAMFLPSFFTGHLIERWGLPRTMGVGAGLLLLATAIHASGTATAAFIAGMVALGVGWNFLFVGATTLLARVPRPVERGRVQGVNDLLVFGFAAGGSFAAAGLLSRFGWIGMQIWVAGATALVLLVLVAMARAGRASPVPADASNAPWR